MGKRQFVTHEVIDGINVVTFSQSLLHAEAMDEVHTIYNSLLPEKLVLDFDSVRQLDGGDITGSR